MTVGFNYVEPKRCMGCDELMKDAEMYVLVRGEEARHGYLCEDCTDRVESLKDQEPALPPSPTP